MTYLQDHHGRRYSQLTIEELFDMIDDKDDKIDSLKVKIEELESKIEDLLDKWNNNE